jgi:hypothetical protein
VRRFEEAITAYRNTAAIYRKTDDPYNKDLALGTLETAKTAQRVTRYPDGAGLDDG